jgi:hypothetical protein
LCATAESQALEAAAAIAQLVERPARSSLAADELRIEIGRRVGLLRLKS